MLGKRILELRKERRLTLRETSEAIGVSTSAVSMYETGKRSPDHETLIKIANFFNVSTDYLLKNETNYADEENKRLLDEAYFKVMIDAKNKGLSPHDLSLAVDFMKRAKRRDNEVD
jgi:transcriptional regulator with XRE-family HTH domain